jgi:hypothetical protein
VRHAGKLFASGCVETNHTTNMATGSVGRPLAVFRVDYTRSWTFRDQNDCFVDITLPLSQTSQPVPLT